VSRCARCYGIAGGAPLPDYELADHTGQPQLSDLQGDHPMNRRAGPRGILGEGPSPAGRTRSAVARSGRSSPDPDRIIQRDLDIAEYTDPVHDLMVRTQSCAPGVRAVSQAGRSSSRVTRADHPRDVPHAARGSGLRLRADLRNRPDPVRLISMTLKRLGGRDPHDPGDLSHVHLPRRLCRRA
jgi:hypothetical protein